MPVPLDLIVLGVVVVSALLAAVRGFTREILAIASWAAAAILAYFFHPRLLPVVREHIANENIALGVAIGAIFLVTLLIVSFITVRLSEFVLDSRVGALDRTLGFLFGAGRGFLICVIGFLFFNWLLPDKQQEWTRSAKSTPLLQATGEKIKDILPDDPEGAILSLKKLKRPKGDEDAPAEGETTPKAPANAPQRSGNRT